MAEKKLLARPRLTARGNQSHQTIHDLIDILVNAISSLEKRIDAIDLTKRPRRQASPTLPPFSKSET
jgi:hypothetical protein